MRLILMGTGPFAVPTFECLVEQGHEIASVVTRPEVPSSNPKKQTPPSPVRLWAESRSLAVASPASINTTESIEWLRSLSADLMVVCDYGQILSSDCLSVPRLGGVNLHGSLLPRHRGAAPVQWSILSGDNVAGVSIIHMTPGLDAGPVISQQSTPIDPSENGQDLEKRLSELGTIATLESIEKLKSWSPSGGQAIGFSQDKALATKAPRLNKSDGALAANWPLRIIDRQIRGLYPWPGCYGNFEFSNGQALRIIVHEATPLPIALSQLPAGLQDKWTVGSLLYGDNADSLRSLGTLPQDFCLGLVANDGLLILKSVQPSGKKRMTAEEFIRGYARMEWVRLVPLDEPNALLARMQQMEPSQ